MGNDGETVYNPAGEKQAVSKKLKKEGNFNMFYILMGTDVFFVLQNVTLILN